MRVEIEIVIMIEIEIEIEIVKYGGKEGRGGNDNKRDK